MSPPAAPPIAGDVDADVAAEIGFAQCVQSVRRTLLTTPVGWVFTAWVAWSRAPHRHIVAWLALFCGTWFVSMLLLRSMRHRNAPSRARHAVRLCAVAGLDGLGWGLVCWLLTGYDASLDPWLGAIMCGVSAVNAPVYISYIRAYHVLVSTIWITVCASALVRASYDAERQLVIGIGVYSALLVYYMRDIARRVLEGIRLQLSNASLAERLHDALQHVRHEAATDALTGQPNRRALDGLLQQQLALAREQERPFSVLLLDIDHFKQVNDAHGHATGDATLQAFAGRVREHLRQGDTCARYGGEEFVVVLPGGTLADALEVGERLRRGVEARPLLVSPAIPATVSIGAAQHRAGETIEALLARADGAVYAAKRGGRNQVRVLEDAPSA